MSEPRKRGNRLGFWFFRTVIKTSGLSSAYVFLYPVCLYYLLFDASARRAAEAYIRRRFPSKGFIARMLAVYRLFIAQGECLIDRFVSAETGMSYFDTDVVGYDKMVELLSASGRGAILLTAHVGNWQITMSALGHLGRPVYLMMRPEDNAPVRESLKIYQQSDWLRILYPKDFAGGTLEALDAISKGALVSIMGDRSYGHRTEAAELLGGTVHMPMGAFMLAAAAKCPVIVLLSAKAGPRKYIVDVSEIISTEHFTRKTRSDDIRRCVQRYAGILERYAGLYPYQWFVFHDLWAALGNNEKA